MKVEIQGLGALETEPRVLNHIATAFFAASTKYEAEGCPNISVEARQIAFAIYEELDKIGYFNDQYCKKERRVGDGRAENARAFGNEG